jgi:hypothetical protein
MDIRITNQAWDNLLGAIDVTSASPIIFRQRMDKFAADNNARFVDTIWGLHLHFNTDADYFLFLLKHGDIEK